MLKGGFFSPDQLAVKSPPTLVPRCGACGLLSKCKSPKMPLWGEGKREILIVGEAPGEREDEVGRPFVGKSGQMLKDTLRSLGVEMGRDCWVTNALSCRPPGNLISDQKRIEYCRPLVVQKIESLKPKVIILLGGSAVHSVIGWLWKNDVGGVNRWVGWAVPDQKLNAWVCPTYHPSYVMREGETDSTLVASIFASHLAEAVKLEKRPWKRVPDFKSQVEVIYEPDEAAQRVDSFSRSEEIAFDYETDRLKPDHDDSQIVCCSVSDGKTTIAYPWRGKAIQATKALLKSEVPKIAANVRFEHRWTYRHLKCQVNNWGWDTVLGAHLMDNRPDICSLKFQSYILLGQPDYDHHVEEMRKGEGGNGRNRMKEVEMKNLLEYCGLDSLLEKLVADTQREILGYQK
jgi:uracil-DNA glycosylase family 4